jgi:hypothetical protein
VGEECDGVIQGALSVNVTKPYHQLETCVEPYVGHVVACTWHWIFARCHGLVGICVESFQQIWLPYQPQYENGKILPVWMQWVELRQLGPMVGTLSTCEKECG